MDQDLPQGRIELMTPLTIAQVGTLDKLDDASHKLRDQGSGSRVEGSGSLAASDIRDEMLRLGLGLGLGLGASDIRDEMLRREGLEQGLQKNAASTAVFRVGPEGFLGGFLARLVAHCIEDVEEGGSDEVHEAIHGQTFRLPSDVSVRVGSGWGYR